MHEIPAWLAADIRRRNAIRREAQRAYYGRVFTVVGICALLATAILLQPLSVTYENTQDEWVRPDPCGLDAVICDREETNILPTVRVQTAYAYVTGYNTVPEQTDSTPCIAASGANICGRTDVVACPRKMPFGTKVEIDGKVYTCEDRLAEKYDNRIDISCDKDTACPAQVTGVKRVTIKQ